MNVTHSQSIKKFSLDHRNTRRRDAFVLFILLVLGFFSSQRFLLPDVSAISCFLIFCLMILLGFDKKDVSTLLLLSLFAMVDLGGEAYSETPALIRYILYSAGLLFLFAIPKFRSSRASYVLLIFSLVTAVNTISHPYNVDLYTFFRDLLCLCLIFIVSLAWRLQPKYSFNYPYMVAFSLGMIASEFVNIQFFYHLSSEEYLNYSSFKFIVFLPLFYWLSTRNYKLAGLISPAIFIVVIAFGSRMLLLTSLIVIFIFLIRNTSRSFFGALSFLIAALLALSLIQAYLDIDFEAFRVLSVFGSFFELDDFLSTIEFLDPVRFTENTVFFNQNLYSLFFGNGLGAGILDTTGIFSFVPDNGAAFTSKELSESHFFRLHDSWTWFGYRFGLLAYIFFVFWGVKGCLNKDPEISFIASLMLLAFFNATFSIGGLIVCAAFALFYKCKLQRSIVTHRSPQ